MRFLLLALALCFHVSSAIADGSALPGRDSFSGFSRLLTKDVPDDGKNRRSKGSYALSLTFGDSVADFLSQASGRLIDYRLRDDTHAPNNAARQLSSKVYPAVRSEVSRDLFASDMETLILPFAGVQVESKDVGQAWTTINF
ncbi:MAG: hypothetical protein GY947_01055 [Rhodobacteraceae bacterium]|nr:hypothetical protein [Paracoccaceae bacterium]